MLAARRNIDASQQAVLSAGRELSKAATSSLVLRDWVAGMLHRGLQQVSGAECANLAAAWVVGREHEIDQVRSKRLKKGKIFFIYSDVSFSFSS